MISWDDAHEVPVIILVVDLVDLVAAFLVDFLDDFLVGFLVNTSGRFK